MSRGMIKVPTNEDGTWIQFIGRRDASGHPHWEYLPVRAKMKIKGMYSSRSAKGFVLTDLISGREFNMFVTDMVTAMQNFVCVKGEFPEMMWTAQKRGYNIGVRPVYPKDKF